MNAYQLRRFFSVAAILFLISSTLSSFAPSITARADHTPAPSSVTVAGSLQSELGCPGDWQPDCAATHLVYDPGDDVWQAVFNVPEGSWEYKAALDDKWDENYGLNAVPGGDNIPLSLAAAASVKFYYSHHTHWITDNKTSRIVTAPGSYQSELGCPGDWQPDCLRSWLQDPDGDGTYAFSTMALPPGNYEVKAAIDESWNENYGQGGIPGGANIPFAVNVAGSSVTFSFVSATNVLTVAVVPPGPGIDNNVFWDGLRHDSRDLLYRTPGGAVPAGTAVKLRFRTYHNDVTGVKVRLYDINANGQQFLKMHVAASDVSCYQEGLPYTCDFWEVTLPAALTDGPDNLWYRFLVTDGSALTGEEIKASLAAHAPAPRQEPRLDVLAERGRGEPRALRLEQTHHLGARDAGGALPLDARDLGLGQEIHSMAAFQNRLLKT